MDDGLWLNTLSEGYYTYEIATDVTNYYVENGALASETEKVVVWTKPFTIGDGGHMHTEVAHLYFAPAAEEICYKPLCVSPQEQPLLLDPLVCVR